MDFFLLLIFDPEPEEVWYACDNNDKIFLILIFLTKNVISKDFVRYILFLYPFLDYMRPKTRNDKKKKITIKGFSFFFTIPNRKLQSFRFVRGDKKRGTIYL
ncbi:hypothetical protein ACJX0J_001729 [Zea mays]